MDTNALEDRKKLWLMCHAQMAFLSVKEASDHIIKHNLKFGDTLFSPLFTSIVVNYARSFKKSNLVGKIVEDLVPAQHLNLHHHLILFRDKLVAHTDGDGLADKYGKVNEVRYHVAKSSVSVSSTQFHLTTEQIKETQKLTEILIEKIAYHIDKIERKHRDKIPKLRGDYILNIDPVIDEFFIPVDPIPEE
jgi:hypothetical protein